MKIRFRLILPLLVLSLSSCASAPAVTEGVQDVHKEKKQNTKKLLFTDWKYKGFGKELPAWFEPAFDGNDEKVKKIEKQLSDSEIVIIRGEGINSDQAERNLDLQKAAVSQDFELYDSFWVKTSGGAYVSLAIYIINKEN